MVSLIERSFVYIERLRRSAGMNRDQWGQYETAVIIAVMVASALTVGAVFG